MDQKTIEKRDKLFRLAFSSTHDGEILNAVSKLKELGVTSYPSQQPTFLQKHNLTEKHFTDLIAANKSLRIELKDRDRLICKLDAQLDDFREREKKARKKIDSLRFRIFFIAPPLIFILSAFLNAAIIF